MNNYFFSRKLIKEAVDELRIPGLIMFFVMLTISAFLGIEMLQNARVSQATLFAANPYIRYSCIFGAPIMVFSIFSFLDKRNSCDFYEALPFKRSCIFGSFMAGTVIWYVIILAGGILPVALCSLINPGYSIIFTQALFQVFYVFVGFILLEAMCALGISLTGTPLTNVVITLMICFVPRMLLSIYSSSIEDALPFVNSVNFPILIENNYNVVHMLAGGGIFFTDKEPTSGPIVYSIIIAVIYLAIAFVVFCKRKSEMAGKASIGRGLQAAIRVIIAMIITSIAIQMIFANYVNSMYETQTYIIVFVYIAAVIAYFAYEMITTKRIKAAFKTAPGLLLVAVLNVIIIFSMIGFYNSQTSFAPSKDEIRCVRLLKNGRADLPRDIANVEIEDDSIKSLFENGLKKTINAYETNTEQSRKIQWNVRNRVSTVTVEITCNNGKKAERIICLETYGYDMLKEYFAKNGELIKYTVKKNLTGKDYAISGERYGVSETDIDINNPEKIYETYENEIRNLSNEECIELIFERAQESGNGPIVITFTNEYDEKMWMKIDPRLPESLNAYIEAVNLASQNCPVREYVDFAKNTMDKGLLSKDYSADCTLSFDNFQIKSDKTLIDEGMEFYSSYYAFEEIVSDTQQTLTDLFELAEKLDEAEGNKYLQNTEEVMFLVIARFDCVQYIDGERSIQTTCKAYIVDADLYAEIYNLNKHPKLRK